MNVLGQHAGLPSNVFEAQKQAPLLTVSPFRQQFPLESYTPDEQPMFGPTPPVGVFSTHAPVEPWV
jgi:hypothetical protein